MAWLAQDIYLNIVKIFDLNLVKVKSVKLEVLRTVGILKPL